MATIDKFTLGSQPSQLTRYVALLQWRMTQYGNDGSEVNLKHVLTQEKEMSRQSFQV